MAMGLSPHIVQSVAYNIKSTTSEYMIITAYFQANLHIPSKSKLRGLSQTRLPLKPGLEPSQALSRAGLGQAFEGRIAHA